MITVTKTELPPLSELDAYLRQIWQTGWLTNQGPLAQKLEAELDRYLGVDGLIYVSNGTVALEIAIKALGLTEEIITTPFSFVATTSSIVWMNCTPVMVDIDPATLNIDAEKIEAAITPRTRAILATHTFGNPCDVEKIETISRRHKIPVIYDAAHCFNVKYRGKSLLHWGDCSTMSYHATKIFHTCEGGGIFAKDEETRRLARAMMHFGFDGPDRIKDLGINAKNSELHAAVGLCMLGRVARAISRRRELSRLYDEGLIAAAGTLRKPSLRPGTEYNYSHYPVLFPSETALLASKAALARKEIFPRRYFYPCLSTLKYVPPSQVPVAEDVSRRILCLPLYPQLAEADLSAICDVVLSSLAAAGARDRAA